MDALSPQTVQIGRQGGYKSLPLASGHLGYLSFMEHNPANQLDIIVPLAEGSPRCLADHGKGFGENFLQRLSPVDPLFELPCPCPDLIIAQRLNLGFLVIDPLNK